MLSSQQAAGLRSSEASGTRALSRCPQRIARLSRAGRVVKASAAASGLVACRLLGVGSSAPASVLSNVDLERYVDTNDEWITSRTGIKRRHVLGEGETMVDHAAAACTKALEMAGVAAGDIDLILLATSTPDDAFGSACQVQAALGNKKAVCFDLTAACSGFVLALVTGAQYVKTGTFKRVLVIGADALSRITDWRDRGTCILFGDGCGAVVLTAADVAPPLPPPAAAAGVCAGAAPAAPPSSSSSSSSDGAPSSSSSSSQQEQHHHHQISNSSSSGGCAILGVDMHSDGAGHKSLNAVYAGGGGKPYQEGEAASAAAPYSNIAMAGQDVFKFAVRSVPAVIEAALAKAELTKEDVDWLVMHQANQRILDSAAQRLGLPPDRVVSNLAEYGNTSAASIPLALDEAVRSGKVQRGDVLALAGFGAGLTWAAAIVRWG